jgi:hypothetical protein
MSDVQRAEGKIWGSVFLVGVYPGVIGGGSGGFGLYDVARYQVRIKYSRYYAIHYPVVCLLLLLQLRRRSY